MKSSFPAVLFRAVRCAALFVLAGGSALVAADQVRPPEVGQRAPGFTLSTLDGARVTLDEVVRQGPVVLVALRGWPGYQCPLCTRQVQDYVASAEKFRGRARVLMVYPGKSHKLAEHAREFLRDKAWPPDFLFVTDPDLVFTGAYGLRWEAPNETAYPSTFVIGRDGRVELAHVSRTHGNRLPAARVLAALK